MDFIKITAKDEVFNLVRNKYIQVYKDFKLFAEDLTFEAGKATKGSNKSGSYARHLIRLAIYYEQFFSDSLELSASFETLKKLESLSDVEGFEKYNAEAGRFPSATISCFRAYIVFKHSALEDLEELKTNQIVNRKSLIKESESEYLINGPTKKPSKTVSFLGENYPRNVLESEIAKKHSGFTCEIDARHTTFINAKNRFPYVESHHLIPMAAQDYFDNTIDFAGNITTLCPNCHRKIHYAIADEKEVMVNFLYEKRKDIYPKFGISIDLKILKNFYGII